jgi:hypothetical protein
LGTRRTASTPASTKYLRHMSSMPLVVSTTLAPAGGWVGGGHGGEGGGGEAKGERSKGGEGIQEASLWVCGGASSAGKSPWW